MRAELYCKPHLLLQRCVTLLAVLVHLMAAIPVVAGAVVLCRGADGHIAVESTKAPYAAASITHADASSRHLAIAAGDGIEAGHAAGCADSALVYRYSQTESRTVALDVSPDSSTASAEVGAVSAIRRALAPPAGPWGGTEGLDPRLRHIRTVILLT